jgi:hypothetical protein
MGPSEVSTKWEAVNRDWLTMISHRQLPPCSSLLDGSCVRASGRFPLSFGCLCGAWLGMLASTSFRPTGE